MYDNDSTLDRGRVQSLCIPILGEVIGLSKCATLLVCVIVVSVYVPFKVTPISYL